MFWLHPPHDRTIQGIKAIARAMRNQIRYCPWLFSDWGILDSVVLNILYGVTLAKVGSHGNF
jgi:hypothetical protein